MTTTRMKYIVYILIVLMISGSLIYGGGIFNLKFSGAASITSFIDSLSGSEDLQDKIKALEKENEDLRVEAFNAQFAEPKTIKVYSSYPLNNTKELTIAGGEDEHIKEGSIVTYGKNILIGKVTKVFSNYSVVETIFDSGWNIAVRIGESQADGLFVGGSKLALTLLPKKSDIKVDDIVISAGPGFPYGLEIGRIKEIKDDASNPLREATLEPAVKFEDIRNVSIRN